MPRYYLKSTNANVEILCQYLNHTKCLQMQNIKENGIKIIRKNMLSTIYNLNIKHPTGNQHISIIGQKKMSNSHQIHHQQFYVKRLCLNFLLILLQKYLKKLVVQFVENRLQFVRWKNFLKLKMLVCSKLMELLEKPDLKALIQLKS